MFLDAPPEVAAALADYAGRGRARAGRTIDDFVRRRSHAIRKPEAGEADRPLLARGSHHDLRSLFDELNATWFGGRVRARIGWGEVKPRRRRRSIRMGVYDHETRTIRVHPALDRREVPAFFVAYIVFHEMLHQAVPGKRRGSRHEHHTAEFRRRERQYPEYQRALAWERNHLGLLLSPL